MPNSDLYLSDLAFESTKIPPSSLQSEQHILGGLMINNEVWDVIAERLTKDDFYFPMHQVIFQAMYELFDRQYPCDAVTVSEHLLSKAQLEIAGGLNYLLTLIKDTNGTANIEIYADIVRDKAILRQLISIGNEIVSSALRPEGRTTSTVLEHSEKLIFKIAEDRKRMQTGGFEGIKPLVKKTILKIEQLCEQEGNITGARTGFTDLDNLTSGLQKSDLIIIAGRPSMGKTTVAMNIAEHFATQNNETVAVFSMEMPSDSLVMRMMSSLGRIDQTRLRSGKLDDDDWPKLTTALNLLNNAKLFIDDSPALSPIEVRSRARRLARENGKLGLIVVDYLQLMQSPGSGESRVQQISDISRGLKALAKELDVPVIALSQLNRNLEQRPNKRPVMSDLRDSGAIEQDADLILFIYRDEVYNENSPEKGTAELIIGKQRNGPLGTVKLTFQGQYTKFDNCFNAPPAIDYNDY